MRHLASDHAGDSKERMMTSVYRSVFMASMAFVVASAADPASTFDGTWKLNAAKSKFQSPAKKGQTVTIRNGLTSIEETLADGTHRKWSYKAERGQDSQITGIENSSVTGKQVNDRTVEHTWKMDKSTSSGRGVLSSDGKTMTYTLTGRSPDGKPFKDVMIFEKQ
jgi:hypothetical protein